MTRAYINLWRRRNHHFNLTAAPTEHPTEITTSLCVDLEAIIELLESVESDRIVYDLIQYGQERALYVNGTRVTTRPVRRYGGLTLGTWRGYTATLKGRARQLLNEINSNQ